MLARWNTGGRKVSLWLPKLCLSYLIFLVVIGLIEQFVGERWWLATLCTYAPQAVFLIPVALLLLPAVFSRNLPALRSLAACGLLFLLLEGVRLPHLPRQLTPGETSVKVLTYNIRSGGGGVEKIAAAIRQENPEVVCLQEASAYLSVPDPMPQLQRLLPEWRFTHTGDVAIGVRGGTFAKVAVQPFPLTGSSRCALGVTTTLHGRTLNIVTTHLATALYPETLTRNRRGIPAYLAQTGEARRLQLQSLRGFLQQFPGPTILCGDFNTPPRGVEYTRLTRTLTDCFTEVGTGFGWSYPAHRPVLRIDYIFVQGGIRPLSARTLSWPHSDHRPVLTTLVLTD